MRPHSEFGASGADRWIKCPGSVTLSRGCHREETPEMAEGTLAHEWAAKAVLGTIVPRAAIADPEMAEAVEFYAAQVLTVWRDTAGVLSVMPGKEWDAHLAVEEICDLQWIAPGMYSYVDAAVYVRDRTCTVFDFKYGREPVSATDNPQLLFYAMGAVHDYNAAGVWCVIIQPRTSDPVRSAYYSREQLLVMAESFERAHGNAMSASPSFMAGDHCARCPALGKCAKAKSHALAEVPAAFPLSKTPPAPHELTPEQRSQVLRIAPLLTAWCDAVKQHAYREAMGGHETPGFKLVKGRRGHRRWKDEAQAACALKGLGVQPNVSKMRTPADIQGEIGEAAMKGLAGIIAQADGNPTLAPSDDPRPAITGGAVADFDESP